MEGIKHNNEIDQCCKDSPDLKHCWHNPEGDTWSTGMFDNAVCCWCGVKVIVHGRFRPEKPPMSIRFAGNSTGGR